jgi:putative two-component system hydrogenase maturation factor HypX/HoxX
MRILLLAHSFNSLTQRLWVELEAWGHEVSLELDVRDSVTIEAVESFDPELIVAPFLKRAIPEPVWRRHRCIVIHPGPRGDRGPSALDWAVLDGETRWGVTALQANAEMDAGDVWASVEFPLRAASKGSLYRNEVTEAAVAALRLTLERIARGERPDPLNASRPDMRGRLRPPMKQSDRAIDWSHDDSATVLRKIRAADGVPGVADRILDLPVHLYDAHPEGTLRGTPGTLIAQRHGAVCRATVDGAVWITHLKSLDPEQPFKLPAAMVLRDRVDGVPEIQVPIDAPAGLQTWRDVRYEEHGAIGILHFAFYNGAMSTAQCRRLLAALEFARRRPVRVIVLAGGPDFWSNGLHLNVIEASPQPAEESWRNINAIDDLAQAIITNESQLTVAAMQGNAGAGGVFLALAADRVYARSGAILNPHYKGMGNLYGSEYWTYLLPKRVGHDRARSITEGRLPMSAQAAEAIGLIDDHFGAMPAEFLAGAVARAAGMTRLLAFESLLETKIERRRSDEATKPLATYRAEELERMRLNFFGFDSSYHVARSSFVRKVPKSRTPLYLARHRALPPRRVTRPAALEM